MKFSSSSPGQIIAIRFYKSPSETGLHTGKIFSGGSLLTSVTFTDESASGWQVQALSSPLTIAANTEYLVEVNTGGNYYVATVHDFSASKASTNLFADVSAGVFGPSGGQPATSFNATNYFRDIVFVPSSATPTPTPTPTPADQTAPTVVLTTSTSSSFNAASFDVTATFSESVTGFALSDINVTNGAASNLSGSGATYTFTVTPTAQGAVTVAVGAGVAQDAAANLSTAAADLIRTYDASAPTVAISSSAGASTSVSPIPFTITFSENVTGFDSSDVLVGNGVITGFTGSGSTYSINVTPTLPGAVTIDVNAGVAQDDARNGNASAAQFTRSYDATRPTLSLNSGASDPFKSASFTVTATFSESVTGFTQSDVSVTNGTVSVSGSGSTYTLTVTPTGQGLVTVAVAADVAQDAAGNTNTAATSLTRTYDSIAPTATLSSAAGSSFNTASFSVTATFSESVTGFALDDVTVTNGTTSSLSGSGTTYTFTVTPTGQGLVTVALGAGGAQDSAGNGNTAATNLTRTYDSAAPTVSSFTAAASVTAAFSASLTFSESVTGLTTSDFTVTNGTATAVTGSGSSYSLDVTPTAAGNVSIELKTSSVADTAGNAGPSSTSSLTVSYAPSNCVGAIWCNQAYLKAANAGANDMFGLVAVSGDVAVVGAEGEDSSQTTITNGTTAASDNLALQAGAAYVYRRMGSSWAPEAYLKASNAESEDRFGGSAAVSGDTIAVGSQFESSAEGTIINGTGVSTDNNAGSAGAVFVYRRSGSAWVQEAYLKASNVGGGGDAFGWALALDGDTLVVAAPYEDSNQTTITNGSTASSNDSLSEAGAAYVFRRTGSTWVQEAYLKPPNPGSLDYFGFSIALSGDTIVVGAQREDSNQTTVINGTTVSVTDKVVSQDSGAAYVFRRTGTTWTHEAYLKAPNLDGNDYFGDSVSISGNTIVVGAPWEASLSTTIMNGTTASSDDSGSQVGAAYVFRRTGTTWAHEAYLKAPNAQSSQFFGDSVSISGDTIVVGASNEESDQSTIINGSSPSTGSGVSYAGAAYVFRRTGTSWASVAYLKAPNVNVGQNFGSYVSISGDTIVVGAPGESSAQTTVTNGATASADTSASGAGAAYVFNFGSGVDAKTIGAAEIEYNPVGGETVSVTVKYSDDNSTWTTAGSTTLATSGTRTYRWAFTPSSHRYWQLSFDEVGGNSCINGAVELAEARLYLLNGKSVDLSTKTALSSTFGPVANVNDGSSATSATISSSCTGTVGWDFGP